MRTFSVKKYFLSPPPAKKALFSSAVHDVIAIFAASHAGKRGFAPTFCEVILDR